MKFVYIDISKLLPTRNVFSLKGFSYKIFTFLLHSIFCIVGGKQFLIFSLYKKLGKHAKTSIHSSEYRNPRVALNNKTNFHYHFTLHSFTIFLQVHLQSFSCIILNTHIEISIKLVSEHELKTAVRATKQIKRVPFFLL